MLMLKDYRKLAYDFEVFSKAGWWMLTVKDIDSGERTVIVDDKKKLKDYKLLLIDLNINHLKHHLLCLNFVK